jgi:hypothetical protein
VLDPESEHVAGVYGVGIGIFGFEGGEAGDGAVEGGKVGVFLRGDVCERIVYGGAS